MSDAALNHVRACTHPQVKFGVLALFTAIAELVPDGQTTTPPLTLPELAAQAQRSSRTAQDCRDVLEAIGAIKVHDGGRGKVARYEILNLAGERPLSTAPLPLRADLRAAKAPRTKEQRSGSDLFSDVEANEQRSTSEVSSDVSVYVGSFFRRWWAIVGSFFRRCAPPWRRLVRARDVHTFKELHTPAAAREDEHQPPPRIRHPWHVWCGVVCVPHALHQEFLRKGHDAAWLTAFYARTCDALAPSERITVDDFKFWRAAMKAELATATARAPTVRAEPSVDGATCPHHPRCRTDRECIERVIADGRAERERQTG